MPRTRLSTSCLMAEHTSCLGCRCDCHPSRSTRPLAVAITVIVGVTVLVGIAWASR